MFSVLDKKEDAHEHGIWTCAWGRKSINEKLNDIKDNPDVHTDSELEKPSSKYQNFIVTGGLDDLVKIWDVENDNIVLRQNLEGHSLGIVSVDVSSDGKTIASSSLDSGMCIWNAENGVLKSKLPLGPVDLWTVAFSPCNKYVISGSHEGKISLYSVETGKPEQVFDPQNGKFTLSLAYSPDGKYIASGGIDGIITIFDVASGKVAQTLEGHALSVRSICFSPDSQMLLTASDDGHMKLYDVAHSDIAGTLSGHASWVLSVAFSADGKNFVSSSSDTTVKIWNFAERKCFHTFTDHTDQVWCVKYNANNDRVISVSEDRNLFLYNCPPNVII